MRISERREYLVVIILGIAGAGLIAASQMSPQVSSRVFRSPHQVGKSGTLLNVEMSDSPTALHEKGVIPPSIPISRFNKVDTAANESLAVELPPVSEELDLAAIESVKAMLTIPRLEKEFLMREVGLSEMQYQHMKARRKLVYEQIAQRATHDATKPAISPSTRERILRDHEKWMRHSLGSQNYGYLQQISLEAVDLD